MFDQLIAIIQKNLKLVMRSKSSALLIILAPLLIILLIGASFNSSNLYGLKIGAYSETYTNISDSLVRRLIDKEFDVTKTESSEICINGVKEGNFHVCAIFPEGLDVNNETTINFWVDYSKINLVYLILNSISEGVSSESSELSTGLVNVLLDELNKTENELTLEEKYISSLSIKNNENHEVTRHILNDIASFDTRVGKGSYRWDAPSSKDLESKLAELGEVINDSEAGSELNSLKDEVDSYKKRIKIRLDNTKSELELYENRVDHKVEETKDLLDGMNVGLLVVQQGLAGDSEDILSINKSTNLILEGISSIQLRQAERIANPITLSINPVSSKSSHLNSMLPALIILFVMFVGILMSSTIVTREKKSKAHFRNVIAPINSLLMVAGDYFTSLFVALVQIAIIFAVTSFFFKGIFSIGVLITVLLASTLFILLGFIIGHVSRSEEGATMASISVASLSLLFSDIILPIESLPVSIKNIVKFNPFVLGEESLKKLLLFNVKLDFIADNVYALVSFILVFIIIIFVLKREDLKWLFR
ncbi:ABC transporter permease [Candidatus Woesearchaeota archaeon]|nr:ABC transporter permease [Candidatus Woesearchaeota archaeon]